MGHLNKHEYHRSASFNGNKYVLAAGMKSYSNC